MGAQGSASNQTGMPSPVKTVSAVKNNNGKAEVEIGGGKAGLATNSIFFCFFFVKNH